MGETMKLAVPTMGEAGLESERAGHFGHCDCFTVVEIADGEITGTSEVANPSARGRRVHASGRLWPKPEWTLSWRRAWASAASA